MEAIVTTLLVLGGIGFLLWRYYPIIEGYFVKKPVEPQQPTISTEVAKVHDHNRSGTHEHIGHINEPIQQDVVKPPRHEIVKHDYYRSYDGEMWPRWVCRCGASDYHPTTVYTSIESAQRKARKGGQAHVFNATEADRRLDESNGKFAF